MIVNPLQLPPALAAKMVPVRLTVVLLALSSMAPPLTWVARLAENVLLVTVTVPSLLMAPPSTATPTLLPKQQ